MRVGLQLADSNNWRFFLVVPLTCLFSLLLFTSHYINKATQQRSWQGIGLVSNGTWVRSPGPPCYFNIFLANVIPRSVFSREYHRPPYLCLPPIHEDQTNGLDLENSIRLGQ